MNLLQMLRRALSSEPLPTGNADVDEVRLYNYLATPCDLCGVKPAHRHGEVTHCDACCHRRARALVDAAEQRPA